MSKHIIWILLVRSANLLPLEHPILQLDIILFLPSILIQRYRICDRICPAVLLAIVPHHLAQGLIFCHQFIPLELWHLDLILQLLLLAHSLLNFLEVQIGIACQ